MDEWVKAITFTNIYNTKLSNKRSYEIICVKGVRIRSYYGAYFPTFGLNNSEYGHFSPSDKYLYQREKLQGAGSCTKKFWALNPMQAM